VNSLHVTLDALSKQGRNNSHYLW